MTAEAVMAIDPRAEVGSSAASCPRCDSGERVRWGRTRTCDQRTDRERRTHSALRTQRGTAIKTHAAQSSHQYREQPYKSFPQLHAAVLRSSRQDPRSLRSMACRTRQCRPQQSQRAQAVAGVTPSRQHALLTPPGQSINGRHFC